MSVPDEIDFDQLVRAADAIIQQICGHLQSDRGVHIETAISAAGSLAGVAILRNTELPFTASEPGQVQVVLAEEVNQWGSSVVEFMVSVCDLLELDAAFGATEIPPEHQPNQHLIEGVLDWVWSLEVPCNEILDELDVDRALRPYIYAFTSLKLVKDGEAILDPVVGKALALAAIVAGSKTAPYRQQNALIDEV